MRIYPNLPPRTTDWWQLKAILEHHYSPKRLKDPSEHK
jgi:hypothetical protein